MKLTVACFAALSLGTHAAVSSFYSTLNFTLNSTLPRPWVPRSPRLWAGSDGPADEATWGKAKCKGKNFVDSMPLTDAAAGAKYTPPRDTAESPFTGDLKADLQKWGWSNVKLPASVCELNAAAYGPSWDDVLKKFGIKNEAWKDIWCYGLVHGVGFGLTTKKYTVDGKDYPMTGAYANYGVNAADGAIFAMDNLMPASAFRKNYQRDPDDAQLPQLRALSDLVWSGWYQGSQPETSKNGNLKNIKHLFSISVTNQETISIIKRALETKGKTDVAMWPGDSFDMSTPEGQALLGSPNGRRWGYLLTQHKNDLGTKAIDSVDIFVTRAGSNPMMVFHVKDAVPVTRREALKFDMYRSHFVRKQNGGILLTGM